ncbi:hypothetical protein ORI98_03425 [Shewanella sp. ULN5]|uniref:hypothetical protein n=1 Tax=Shewanella sp. ULN5 TaxID=2994678 RepID=UPI00273D53AE|nr:hypothetical protein [Shewanella sp. ULN5]MDP5145489.1 hypothetical protein [Shewanella sp. ULN5]
MNLNTHGTVIGINPKTSRIAVQLHDGDISVMDVDDLSDFAINHVLYGTLDEETEQVITNKTMDTKHEVTIEATGCNLKTARYLLFLK